MYQANNQYQFNKETYSQHKNQKFISSGYTVPIGYNTKQNFQEKKEILIRKFNYSVKGSNSIDQSLPMRNSSLSTTQYFVQNVNLNRGSIARRSMQQKDIINFSNQNLNNNNNSNFMQTSYQNQSLQRDRQDNLSKLGNTTDVSLINENFQTEYCLDSMINKTSKQKLEQPDIKILNELDIREQYYFKFPVIISQMENQNSSIHFLEDFKRGCQFLQQTIDNFLYEKQKYIQQKQQIKQEIQQIKDNHEKEMNELIMKTSKMGEYVQNEIKTEYIKDNQLKFKLNKEFIILTKEKMKIENDLIKAQIKIGELEKKCFGVELFDLQTDKEELNELTQQTWRNRVIKTEY